MEARWPSLMLRHSPTGTLSRARIRLMETRHERVKVLEVMYWRDIWASSATGERGWNGFPELLRRHKSSEVFTRTVPNGVLVATLLGC